MSSRCFFKAAFTTAFLFVAVATHALGDATETYGFRERSTTPAERYDFEFVRAESDSEQWKVGVFKFRWKGDKPIQLWGFGFEKGGSFRPRFESFSRMTGKQWSEVPLFYCGTGAEMHVLQPNKDYIFRIPLKCYQESGERGVVQLGGDGVAVISKPFDVASMRQAK